MLLRNKGLSIHSFIHTGVGCFIMEKRQPRSNLCLRSEGEGCSRAK